MYENGNILINPEVPRTDNTRRYQGRTTPGGTGRYTTPGGTGRYTTPG